MDISVVIPAYNSARFLPRALDSVLAQTHPAQEIIVVDDGSQDDTAQVIARYGDRVRYVWQANAGPSAARNHGIALAQHPWIALLDGDDWWDPKKLELQALALAAKPNAGLCYTGLLFIDEVSGDSQTPAIPEPRQVLKVLRYQNNLAPSTIVARRADILAVGGFNKDLRGTEDWEMWVKLSRRFEFAFVPQPVTLYQITVGSVSANYDRMIKAMEMMLEPTLVSDLSGLSRAAWKRRIRAAEFYRAFLVARQVGHAGALSLLWKSVVQWPLPTFMPKRFYSLVLYISGGLKGRPKVQAAS